MCGIVGLHLRTPELYPRLGELLTGMLCEMGNRGSDSAGVAVYGDPIWSPPGRGCVSVLEVRPAADDLGLDVNVTQVGDTYLLTAEVTSEVLLDAVRAAYPQALIAGFGSDMAVFKGVGHPRALTESWGLARAQGWQGVGHTRMATESAVTTLGAHPFSTGADQCLVHNGSLSNHNNLRRELVRENIVFETENDTEVAAAYLTAEMAKGKNLREALTSALEDLDGFFTFVVGTKSGFGVLRDPIACKPAVMAETDGYVAFGSEYRALVGLPDIERARVWEPEPATVYFWEHAKAA
jgi:methylamine---glutamate N-methyltransferase subunit A